MNSRPEIVCLCGSTKFKSEFESANRGLTLLGKIVLSIGFFGHDEEYPLITEVKKMLDELHLRKIDLADRVVVICPSRYVEESTRNEINYAVVKGKPITYYGGENAASNV